MEEVTTMEENTTEEVQDPQAVLAALRKAQADIKRLSDEKKSLGEELESLRAQADSASGDEWRAKALTAEVKNALRNTGLKDVDRLMPYVGTEGIDFDESGALTGLDERITKLKADLPELFDVKRKVGGKADIFANDSAETNVDPLRNAIHKALNAS